MNKLDELLRIISEAPKEFNQQLSNVEQQVYSKVLNITKELEIDSKGSIKPSIANLKKMNEIKMQLSRVLMSKSYTSSVTEYITQFQRVALLQNAFFNQKNSDISKLVTKQAIDNTVESLTGKGYTEIVVKQLRDVIQRAITSGGSFRDLTEELNRTIISTEKKPSVISKQVQTPVIDALNIFSAQHAKLVTEDVKTEYFQYVGSNKTTTREFCLHMVEKRYVHISELPTIVTGLIDGHQCKLSSYKLPLGMYEGTDESNFEINRGGYNCGHQFYKVAKEAVPLHIRMKFEKDLGQKAIQNEYKRLKANPNYSDVQINDKGGLKAIHKDHTFHPLKGHYEKEAQDILFKNGDVFILESEKKTSGIKSFDGHYNGMKADIKTIEGVGRNTIKRGLNDARKQGAESVILYYPNKDIFSLDRLHHGLSMFEGQADYRFREIVYIVNNEVYKL